MGAMVITRTATMTMVVGMVVIRMIAMTLPTDTLYDYAYGST